MTEDGGRPRRAGAGWLAKAAAAPLVLGLVLATHVAARRSSDLTPWKGGGFGMFSTVDSPAGRVVRVELDTDVGPLAVAVPAALRDQAGVARAAPSTDRLIGLAREVAEQWWVVPDVAALAGPAGPPPDDVVRAIAAEAVRAVEAADFDPAIQRRLTVRRVRVTVLRPDVETGAERHGLVLTPTPIRTVTIELVPRAGAVAP
jgi:hypothetical protein